MVLQSSNGDHEITPARSQLFRKLQIVRTRTLHLNANVGVQSLNGANKVSDQHPDLLNGLARHYAALSSELNLMLHFHSLQQSSRRSRRRVTEEKAPTG
jgi:hypothetical protein